MHQFFLGFSKIFFKLHKLLMDRILLCLLSSLVCSLKLICQFIHLWLLQKFNLSMLLVQCKQTHIHTLQSFSILKILGGWHIDEDSKFLKCFSNVFSASYFSLFEQCFQFWIFFVQNDDLFLKTFYFLFHDVGFFFKRSEPLFKFNF